jgi:hypothetical protein
MIPVLRFSKRAILIAHPTFLALFLSALSHGVRGEYIEVPVSVRGYVTISFDISCSCDAAWYLCAATTTLFCRHLANTQL